MANENGITEDNFLDEPIDIDIFENDDNIEYDNDFFNSDPDFQESQNPNQGNEEGGEESLIDFEDDLVPNKPKDPVVETPPASTDNPDFINFDDPSAVSEDEDVFKEEEAVEKLKNLGYKVEKSEEESPSNLRTREIQKIDKEIDSFKQYMKASDEALCREKAILDVRERYIQQGRQSAINSEEFNMEVEDELEDYKFNEKLLKLTADLVRKDLKEVISLKEKDRNGLKQEEEKEKAENIKKNRLSLQKTFSQYNKKNVFGVEVTPEVIKQAYHNVTSGDFTKKVNNDQNIQAEFALFLELRDKIDLSGGGNYREGIAKAVNLLTGDGQPRSRTSLDNTVQRNAGNKTLVDRYSKWSQRTNVEKK